MIFTATAAPRRSVYAPALRSLDRFLDDALTVARTAGANITEDEQTWTLAIDVPGVSREQLAISIDGATVKVETAKDAARQYRKVYEFGQEVDAAGSSAKLELGVLTLTLAKRRPQPSGTTLTIQ